MGNTLTICKRELGAYFNSPVAYVVITAYLVTAAVLYFVAVFMNGEASMRRFFLTAPLIFIFFAPAISMRLIAEEKRTGTIAMLFTLPVTDWEVVLGKFFAALGVFTVAIFLTLAFPITISTMGNLDWGVVVAGYIGLLMLASAYLAIGLMASSWTENQVVAFIVAFSISFALFLVGQLVSVLPPSLAPILRYISIDAHFANIARGVLDTRDVIYYLSLTGGCLFVAKQSLDSRRWR